VLVPFPPRVTDDRTVRTQQERDEQTLDIVSAVFGPALLYGIPVVVIVVLGVMAGVEVPSGAGTAVGAILGALYVGTVVWLLNRRAG
jgi:hypothetical protein